ncbi:MAG: hypothetical protein AAF732_03240 [Pseudomonadota bacterium]
MTEPETKVPHADISDAERKRRQKTRSIAIGVGLALLALLFYLATIVHMGGNVFKRPI